MEESLKRRVEDLAFDLDSQSKKAVKEEGADKTLLRLFSGGSSAAEATTLIRETRRLLGDKVELKLTGEKRAYLNDLRRDLCVVSRVVVAHMIGKRESIRQVDHDDGDVGKTTTSSTFASAKTPDQEKLVDLLVDVAGTPEGESAIDGADFIVRELSRAQRALDERVSETWESVSWLRPRPTGRSAPSPRRRMAAWSARTTQRQPKRSQSS